MSATNFSRNHRAVALLAALWGATGCGAQGSYARNDDGGGEPATGGSSFDGGGPDAVGGGGGTVVTMGSGGFGGGPLGGAGGSGVASGGTGPGEGGSGAAGLAATGGGGGGASGSGASGGAMVGTGGTSMQTGGAGGSAATGGGPAGGAAGARPGTGGTAGPGSGGAATGGLGAAGAGAGTGGMGTGGSGAAGGTGTGGAPTGGTGGVQLILSIDFVGGSMGAGGGPTIIPSMAMDPSEVAGVRRAAHWNSAPGGTGSLTALALSDGSTIAASATWNSPTIPGGNGVFRNAFPDAPGDVRMMNGYLDPASPTAPATVTISQLPAPFATAGYDVYVYVTGDVTAGTTRTYTYVIGGASFTISQTGPTPNFAGYHIAPPGGAGNFIVFRNVSGSSFTLRAGPGSGALVRSPVNGIQIVSPTGS